MEAKWQGQTAQLYTKRKQALGLKILLFDFLKHRTCKIFSVLNKGHLGKVSHYQTLFCQLYRKTNKTFNVNQYSFVKIQPIPCCVYLNALSFYKVILYLQPYLPAFMKLGNLKFRSLQISLEKFEENMLYLHYIGSYDNHEPFRTKSTRSYQKRSDIKHALQQLLAKEIKISSLKMTLSQCEDPIFDNLKQQLVEVLFDSLKTYSRFIGSIKVQRLSASVPQKLSQSRFIFITKLQLRSNNISDAGMRTLSGCHYKYLQSLDVSVNPIKNTGIKYLSQSHWVSLKSLKFSTSNGTVDMLKYLRKHVFKKLEHLVLYGPINELMLNKLCLVQATQIDVIQNSCDDEGWNFRQPCKHIHYSKREKLSFINAIAKANKKNMNDLNQAQSRQIILKVFKRKINGCDFGY